MTTYETIISTLQNTDATAAEHFQEAIDIMIHKLKFLSPDTFPQVMVVQQEDRFETAFSTLLEEKINIAGGRLLADSQSAADVVIIIQKNDELYSLLPSFIAELREQGSKAIENNKVFIIQSADFNSAATSYLADTESLAEIIQPKYFFFGRDGQDWVKFDL